VKMGCDVVTVSTDTEFVHLAWKKSEKELANVKYPMAADRTGRISRMFGVYDEATGHALRGTFVVNPEGVLRRTPQPPRSLRGSESRCARSPLPVCRGC